MVRPMKRRHSSVGHTKHLIEAIKYIRQQKQIPNVERITRYMNREHGLRVSETEKHLHYAVKDNMIMSYTAVGKKGSMTGIKQEGFRIPEEEEELKGDHDWYCFECHTAGEVLPCSDCWRVFHPSCTLEEWTGPQFTCTICKDIEAGRQKNKIKRKLLNTLLSYTIMRMKEKTRELHRIGHREEEQNYDLYLIYKPMDLNRIEHKVEHYKYKCLEEFLADTQLIFHNIYLIYGDEAKGGMTELARIMTRDCKYDVEEIRQCQNCYYMSNAKPHDWFCQPCDPPHELVYAKLKGYSYWPAKVIRIVADKYDVRFFGGLHQRALLPKEAVKSIEVNIKSLTVKRTAGFVKACEELHKHQQMLAQKVYDMEDDKEEEDKEEEEEEEKEESGGEEEVFSDNEDEEEDGVRLDNSPLEVSSTSVSPSKKKPCIKAPTPEDTNMVTSSEDKINNIPKVSTSSIACQTTKKVFKNFGVQTEPEAKPEPEKEKETKPVEEKVPSPPQIETPVSDLPNENKCNCKEQYTIKMADLTDQLEKMHKGDKERALRELSDRLKKDFEEDKQQAVSRAMTNMNREIDRVKQQTDEKCKKEYMEEMKKLANKHKEAISQTKKKQWCFNCEEEAMYHCCWNTSYCSVKCQQEHWHKEHKRVCRRKR